MIRFCREDTASYNFCRTGVELVAQSTLNNRHNVERVSIKTFSEPLTKTKRNLAQEVNITPFQETTTPSTPDYCAKNNNYLQNELFLIITSKTN